VAISWLNAAAFAGLALVALPIAIHLLVRRQTRTLLYPSLRFLRETAVAAFRRQRIQDAALLACRVAIVAAAVAALAAPLVVTSSRTASYARRLARAVVLVEAGAVDAYPALAADTFRAARFQRTAAADALADAVRWLGDQPPAAREIVLAGVWRRGSVTVGDLDVVPTTVGIRFEPADPPRSEEPVMTSLLTRRDGTLARIDRDTRFSADATTINDAAIVPVPSNRIRIAAEAKDEPLAGAALAAALEAGVPWTRDDRSVVLMWPGADAPDTAGADVVDVQRPASPAHAASAIVNALEPRASTLFVEPVLIPRDHLDEWSRAPGPPPLDAPLADERDGRWFWAFALALMAVEHWLRNHSRRPHTAEAVDVRAA
jgi:hypothetical protein